MVVCVVALLSISNIDIVIFSQTCYTALLYLLEAPKNMAPFSHYTYRQKWGGSISWNVKICLMHMPPSSVPRNYLIHVRSAITMTTEWKNGSFAEPVLLKSAALVLTPNQEPSKQLAFCSGDRGLSCVSSCSQCNQQKLGEDTVTPCVHVYEHNGRQS